MSSVVHMCIEDLLSMNYVDYAYMNIICDQCNRKYGTYGVVISGRYYATHNPRAKCRSRFSYNTVDILNWKLDDDQCDDLRKSLIENPGHPIARVYNNWIVDGGHRLAIAALQLNMRKVPVETKYDRCARDSNGWYPGMPIDTDTIAED